MIHTPALLPHQADGIAWLQQRKRCILADEMGLGKTVQALMALPPKSRTLVMAPLAALEVWRDHCEVWRPDLSCHVVRNPDIMMTSSPGELLITNHDCKLDSARIAHPDLQLIVDEAQAFKGGGYSLERAFSEGSQRWQRLRELSELSGGCWMLTGTPLLRDPFDVWALLDAARIAEGKPGLAAFRSWDEFVYLTGAHDEPNNYAGFGFRMRFPYSMPNAPQVRSMLAPFLLRRDKSVLLPPLPPKINRKVSVGITSTRVQELFERLGGKAGIMKAMRSNKHDKTLNELRHELAIAKGKAFMPLALGAISQGKRFIAFSDFRAPVEQFRSVQGVGIITGDTSAFDRASIASMFQSGKLNAVIGTIGSCGTALTLTKANTVFMIDRSWSPMLDEQAEARAHRIGQKQAVTVITIVADHDADFALNMVHRKKRNHATELQLAA